MTDIIKEIVNRINYYLDLAENNPEHRLAYHGMAASLMHKYPETLQFILKQN